MGEKGLSPGQRIFSHYTAEKIVKLGQITFYCSAAVFRQKVCMSQALFRSLSQRLTTLQKEGLHKDERVLVSPQGAEVALRSDQWVLNLCANNYLGLADDPD